jgi:hypothetical protein
MGRPCKIPVPKAKKIKLSKAQKQYAKMIRSIETDLVKKQKVIDDLNKKLLSVTAELARHNGERENLEGAKKNLEGILAQIPPPEKWVQFTKYVYEYHHHYHHHDHRQAPLYPVYIGPWWQYYYGGSYVTYPSQSQIRFTGLNPSISICDSPNLGLATAGGMTSKVQTCESLPNSVVISQTSSNSGMFMCHNANLPGLTGGSVPMTVNCASSVFETRADAPGISFTSSVSSGVLGGNGAPVEYTKEDADLTASITALQSFGFFDCGTPKIDSADMSVEDLLKVAAK